MLDSFVILAPLLLLPIVALLRFIGCTPFAAAPVSEVKVTPDKVELGPGASQQFTVMIDGALIALVGGTVNTGVTWVGANSNGLYTAPDPFVAPTKTVQVTATYKGDTGKATVTLKAATVTVSPSISTLKPGEKVTFKVTPNQVVTWTPNAPGGVFTAPPAPYKLGAAPVTVTATSIADPTAVGTATVNLIGNGAKFVSLDVNTKGDWKGVYGNAGYVMAFGIGNPVVPANLVNLPLNTKVTFSPPPPVFKYPDPMMNKQALQRPPAFADRIAYAWFNNVLPPQPPPPAPPVPPVLTLEFDFPDFSIHQVAFYFSNLEVPVVNRKQGIEFFDTSPSPVPVVLSAEKIDNFTAGRYYLWDLSGKVRMVIAIDAGPDVILHGIFFNS